MKNSRKQISYTSSITSRRSNSLQRSSIKSRSSHTSALQSIRASRLIKTRKLQTREVFNSIRLRKQFALLSTSDLRNRSFYHTKHRFSFVYISQRYSAFRHTKCQISHVFNQWSHLANSRFAYQFHLSFESSQISQILVTIVAFATILSNSTMICIDIYEQFISIKHLVMNLRNFKSTIAIFAISKIFDRMIEKWVSFSYFLYCITNRFSKNESLIFRHAKTASTEHNESVVIFFVRWHLLRIIFT